MKINFENFISAKDDSIGFRIKISDEGLSLFKKSEDSEKKEYIKVLVCYMTNNFATYNNKKFDKKSILDTSTFVELGIDSLDLVEIEIQLEEIFFLHKEVLSLDKRETISEVVAKIFHNISYNQKN